MDLAFYISEYLHEKGRVELPGFGIFSLENKHAVLDKETSRIIPPSEIIHFEYKKSVFDSALSKFIAQKTGENLFLVQTHLKEEVKKWHDELFLNKKIAFSSLGEFVSFGDQVLFQGSHQAHTTPNYFGLEEINLQEMVQEQKESTEKHLAKEQYQFNHAILWAFLVIVPIVGLIYLGVEHQDLVFGKSSIEDISVKTSTHRINDVPTKAIPKDSVTIDSLKIEYQKPAQKHLKNTKNK